MDATELTLPIRDPTFDGKFFVSPGRRRGEDDRASGPTTDHPRVGRLPTCDHVACDRGISEPAAPALSTDGQENNRGLPAKNEYPVAGRWRWGRGESRGMNVIVLHSRRNVESIFERRRWWGETPSSQDGARLPKRSLTPARQSLAPPTEAPRRPIFLLRRPLLALYSSRACLVFGSVRSRRSPG